MHQIILDMIFIFSLIAAFVFCKVKQLFFLHLYQKKYSSHTRLNLHKANILVFPFLQAWHYTWKAAPVTSRRLAYIIDTRTHICRIPYWFSESLLVTL